MTKVTDNLTPEQLKAVERSYAHFHRLLALLLLDLAAEADTVWLEEVHGHDIRPEGEDNDYHAALYLLSDLSPYQDRLDELQAVQAHTLELLARETPPQGLLLPTVIEGVGHVRLPRHSNYTSACRELGDTLAYLRGQQEQLREIHQRFERHATLTDPKRDAVQREMIEFELAIAALEDCEEEELRVRRRRERVKPYIYLLDGSNLSPYLRKVGLICVGPKVTHAWSDRVRRTRSDKRVLEPLVKLGNLEIYREREWQAAAPEKES